MPRGHLITRGGLCAGLVIMLRGVQLQSGTPRCSQTRLDGCLHLFGVTNGRLAMLEASNDDDEPPARTLHHLTSVANENTSMMESRAKGSKRSRCFFLFQAGFPECASEYQAQTTDLPAAHWHGLVDPGGGCLSLEVGIQQHPCSPVFRRVEAPTPWRPPSTNIHWADRGGQ